MDGFPLLLSALGIVSHIIYAQNLRRFPIVKLTDPLFLLSCGTYLQTYPPHPLSVRYCTRTDISQPSYCQITTSGSATSVPHQRTTITPRTPTPTTPTFHPSPKLRPTLGSAYGWFPSLSSFLFRRARTFCPLWVPNTPLERVAALLVLGRRLVRLAAALERRQARGLLVLAEGEGRGQVRTPEWPRLWLMGFESGSGRQARLWGFGRERGRGLRFDRLGGRFVY